MKRVAMFLILSAPWVMAQQALPHAPAQATSNLVERVQAPSYSDRYCAGFISKENYSKGNYIVAGAESPTQTQFMQGDVVFLEGSGYQEGARFSVIRQLRDPNRSRAFYGQAGAIAELGEPYTELGRLRVTAMRGKNAIAVAEFTCSPMVAGDLVIPFEEKPPVTYRGKTLFERFPASAGSVSGRIVLAKDFDYILGTGQKVYISAGADKGVKVGDYFRAVRTYDPGAMDEVDALSLKPPHSEDTQKNPIAVTSSDYAQLPKRALAEMIVLTVTPTSSTAMITYAVENVTVGDAVELEGGGQ